MDDKVLNAALAGLLHDIGKFSQRAGEGFTETWSDQTQRDFGYQHALGSYDFVRTRVPEAWRAALSGVAYHHRPKTRQDFWIQAADWLSSAEREEDEDTHIPYLQTVFSRVSLNGQLAPTRYWPLARLRYVERSLFPTAGETPEWKENYRAQYKQLWDEFMHECDQRGLMSGTKLSPAAYLENLLAVLQEFTWSVPSAYWKSVPDVSLYDHLRTTAAIATCLAADDRDENWCKDLRQNREAEAALLVSADFSGLQDFIYTITSGGAAKSLRARSFYLQLLTEVIALYVLKELGLPTTNLIYAGGGGFELLAPLSAKDKLLNLEQALVDKLLTAHRGALGLTLEWRAVKAGEFSAFNQAREQLRKRLNRKKRQPFARASPARLAEQIGAPITLGGDSLEFCRVTGDDWDIKKDKDGVQKSRFVLSLEELGSKLPRATHLVLFADAAPSNARPHTWQEALNLFGYEAEIITTQDESLGDKPRGLVRVYRLDLDNLGEERRFLPELQRQSETALAERPVAKLIPLDGHGEILTFDDLAEKSKGIKRWGVLRMDVDNLGKVFQNGLGESASLSRIASLSFGLRLFFEGWLPQLAGDLKDKLYIQYSGGDDLFVVGAWDALPEFALRVRDSFRKFTGENPSFTLSAGIAAIEAKFPLYQAARLAGEAEADAKDFNRGQKNAVNFLERTCSWDEFAEAFKNANRLADWSEKKLIPKSLLQVILSLYQQAKQARAEAVRNKKPKPQYGRWTWMAAYQLTRVARDAKEETRADIRDIQAVFLKPDAQTDYWGFVARWAHYLARGGK
jgi:CRISPR-associated protein Csm1